MIQNEMIMQTLRQPIKRLAIAATTIALAALALSASAHVATNCARLAELAT